MRSGRASLLWLVAASGLTLPCHAAPPRAAVSLAEYTALLRDYRVFLSSKEPDANIAGVLAERFSRCTTVVSPDGRRYVVSNQQDVDMLRGLANGSDDTISEAAKEHGRLLSVLVVPDGAAASLPSDPGKVAASILAHPEFRYRKPKENTDTWFDRFRNRIADSVVNFFRWLSGNQSINAAPRTGLAGLAAFVRYLLIALAAIAALVGLTYLGQRVYRSGFSWKHKTRRSGERDTGLDVGEATVPDAFVPPAGMPTMAITERQCGWPISPRCENFRMPDFSFWNRIVRTGSTNGLSGGATARPSTRCFRQRACSTVSGTARSAGTREQFETVVAIHESLPATPPASDIVTRETSATQKVDPISAPAPGKNPW